jgi:MraZ protein
LAFTGEYSVAVDEKGRMAIPMRFRTEYDSGGFITKWFESCVALLPRATWEGIMSRADPLPFTDADARNFKRALNASAWPIEQDKQGRMVIPAKLRESAGLTGGQAVLIGAGSHLELWSKERWEQLSERMDQPGFLEEQFKGLGI